MSEGLASYPSRNIANLLLVLLGKSCITNEPSSISPTVSGGFTIHVPTLLWWGRFSAGISHPVVSNCSCHLRWIPGSGDGIILGLGYSLGASLRDGRITTFYARAVPNCMPFLIAMETCWLTFPVSLLLVTLVTFPALTVFPFAYSFDFAFGNSFREQ